MKRILLIVPAMLAVITAAAVAQNINPDISVVGDIRAFTTNNPEDPKEDKLQLDLESVELALQGYLNPFVRADVYISYHDGSFEVEEAYATILRGLPGGLQLRAGKYRVDFGKLNLLHPHAYSFLDTPLLHQAYLGEEGLNDIGVNLNWQLPLGDAALTLSGNVLKGDFAKPHEHGHTEHQHAHSATGLWRRGGLAAHGHEQHSVQTDLGYSQRLSLFLPTATYAGVEFGANALQGKLDTLTGREVRLLGADVKYRWAPDKYRSLTVQGEWIRSKRDVHHHHHHEAIGRLDEEHEPEGVERVSADGFFAFFDWRFAQRYNMGAIFERFDHPEEAHVTRKRAGVFAGFQVMEESTILRLLLRRSEGTGMGSSVREAILQLVFSLGPHKAHWF
jgi:hypothetical protein